MALQTKSKQAQKRRKKKTKKRKKKRLMVPVDTQISPSLLAGF